MRRMRCKNLHLSGIDVLMPALVSIDGQLPGNARRVQIAMSFAQGRAQNVVAELVAYWLEESYHRRFAEEERGVDSDLATVAFYDKLSTCFEYDSTLVAALMFPKHLAPAMLDFDLDTAFDNSRSGRIFYKFLNGSELARWVFSGRVRAYLNPAADAAQVAFDELPGGIAFESRSNSRPASWMVEHGHKATAWYGFGNLIRPPAAAIGTLRDAIAAKSRRAKATAASHV